MRLSAGWIALAMTFAPAFTRAATMPAATENFLGNGSTLGGCVFPAPPGGNQPPCVTTGVPPEASGDVGPNHYVQAVNSGYAIWNKTGTLLQAPRFLSSVWTG